MSFHVSYPYFSSFLRPNSISLYGYTVNIYLLTHWQTCGLFLWFWPLWIILLWIFVWKFLCERIFHWASQVALVVKNPPANAGDIRKVGSVPGSGKSPAGGHGNPLQYSCLENRMHRRVWRATVHRVTGLDTTEAAEHANTHNFFSLRCIPGSGILDHMITLCFTF